MVQPSQSHRIEDLTLSYTYPLAEGWVKMIAFFWGPCFSQTVIKFLFGFGITISRASAHAENSISQDVNLEQLIFSQVPAYCDIILFNNGPQYSFNFLPFKRPTMVFNQSYQGRTQNIGDKTYILKNGIFSGSKLNEECHVLVIFDLAVKELKNYDDYVERHFNKLKLILIFPLTEKVSEEIRRYTWAQIWHHHTQIIDHTTGRVLFATKFHTCDPEDPVCVLPGVSKTFGYKNVSPHLHISNWGEYEVSGLPYPRIELHPRSPFSVLDLVQGLEGQMLKHLVLEYNMNLTLITPGDMSYGVKLDNGTWTGIFGLLESKQVDLIGGMMAGNWERMSLGVYLAPLYNSKFSFITRKLSKHVSWTGLFTVLSEMVWVAIFIAFVLTLGFMTYVAQLRTRFRKLENCDGSLDNLSSLSLQLAMSALKQPSKKTPGGPNSLTFTSWSMCLFIIFSVYSSYLTARLSIPDPDRNIDTMEDVYQTQKTLITFRGGTLDLYMKTSSDPDTKYVMDRYHRYSNTIPDYNSLKAVDDSRYVVPLEIKGFQYKILAGLDGIKRKLRNYHVATEPLINVFCSWIASKKLAQREGPAIAVAMLRAQDMGLLTKWSSEPLNVGINKSISTRKMSTTKTESLKSVDRDKKKKLSINALKGVFLVWVVGISVSIVAFFMELVVGGFFRHKPKPRPHSQFMFQYCE